jgi:3-methyl-2-oxobutanoate hydroxymethyltransferase
MSTLPKTLTFDTSTSRANPTPQPMKRLTVPRIRQRKGGEPIVMLTAYTVRMAQLLDPHCDMLLVGDSLGQVIYGLPHTVGVTMEMMALHGAAVVRGSYHAAVIVDMPFGSYEASPEQAFTNAARLLKETGAAAVKLEGGRALAPTIEFLTQRGIPVMGHVGLTPQAVNILGGYGVRGKSDEEAKAIVEDSIAVAQAGAFSLVIEGVLESIAIEVTSKVACPDDRYRGVGAVRRAGAGDRGHARHVRTRPQIREALSGHGGRRRRRGQGLCRRSQVPFIPHRRSDLRWLNIGGRPLIAAK